MGVFDAIREGFVLVHRNWKLVLVQFFVSVLNFLGLLVFVGLPLIVAVIAVGIDISGMDDPGRIADLFRGGMDGIGKYIGIILIVAFGVILYMTYALVLVLYAMGGAGGILADSIKRAAPGFSIEGFMERGRRFFWPLVWFTTLVGLVVMGIFTVLGLGAVVMAVAAETLGDGGGWALEFVKALMVLVIITGFLISVFALFVLTGCGTALIVLRDIGAWEAFKETFRFIDRRPGLVGLVSILLFGYLVIDVGAIVVGFPLTFVPVVGGVFALLYQTVLTLLQGYLNLAVLASVIAYCHGAASGGSTQEAGTSSQEAHGHEPPPEGWGSWPQI